MQTKDFAKLQDFAVGGVIELAGKNFTVEEIDPKGQLHLIKGGRGAGYFVRKYTTRKGHPEKNLFILVAIKGGAPVRGKNGHILEAHIFGDLITDATH